MNVKDLALMDWMGANSLRTSHYTYAEEMLWLCDAQGVVFIEELPAVGLHANFVATGLLDKNGTVNTWEQLKTTPHHREVLETLVERDEHYACVVMWSIANEPAAEEEGRRSISPPCAPWPGSWIGSAVPSPSSPMRGARRIPARPPPWWTCCASTAISGGTTTAAGWTRGPPCWRTSCGAGTRNTRTSR